MQHEQILERVLAWARAEDNVRAVVLTGSAGRGQVDKFAASSRRSSARPQSPAISLPDAEGSGLAPPVTVRARCPLRPELGCLPARLRPNVVWR